MLYLNSLEVARMKHRPTENVLECILNSKAKQYGIKFSHCLKYHTLKIAKRLRSLSEITNILMQ